MIKLSNLIHSSPTEMFLNRLQVDSIDVGNVVKLDANHLVVVYRQLEEKIESRIVRGPCIFVPSAQEWLVGLLLLFCCYACT